MLTKYRHTNLLQLRSLCKEISGDLNGVYWTDVEWNRIIQEVLLTFGALSSFRKDTILIQTEDKKRIYDIFVDALDDTIIKPSLTYQTVIDWFNAFMIEALPAASNLFTLGQVLKLIEKKYNQYQLETNLVLSQLTLNVPAENNLVILSNDTIDIVRIAFHYDDEDGNDQEVILNKVDEAELGYFVEDNLSQEGLPLYFSTVYGSPNEIKLYPVPPITGELEVLTISGRDTSVPLVANVVINLPNNLVPYLKYGIIEDIFSQDGILNDPERANYARQRWQEGIAIGKNYYSILIATANGLSISTDSLNKLDDFLTPDSTDFPPTILGLAGFNIFEVDTIPSATINSISLLVTSNFPFPVVDLDWIDVEQSYILAIRDYCIHVAQMKSGAAYLSATNNYLDAFLKTSLNHNKRLQQRGITFDNLMKSTKREEIEKPRLVEQNG